MERQILDLFASTRGNPAGVKNADLPQLVKMTLKKNCIKAAMIFRVIILIYV